MPFDNEVELDTDPMPREQQALEPLLNARVKRYRQQEVVFGTIESVDLSTCTGEKLYWVRFDNGEFAHLTETKATARIATDAPVAPPLAVQVDRWRLRQGVATS